jgi:PTH1 family peptidyl-tRNA hydrolase
MAIDHILSSYKFSSSRSKFNAIINDGEIESYKVLAVKPQTYMNLSGNAIGEIVRYYKIPISDVIVIHDDLDLPVATIRIKIGGSSGGHNGLNSIDSHIGKEYCRLRIGIGHPGDRALVANYVLSEFSKQEKLQIDELIQDIGNNIGDLIKKDKESMLNKIAMLRGI